MQARLEQQERHSPTRPSRKSDPLALGDVQLVLHDVPLPEAGKYRIELRCDGELISQRPFYVEAAKPACPISET